MGWDRKRRGAAGGYYYASTRLPGKPHPVKVYVGRGDAAHTLAADVERRQEARRAVRTALQAEAARTADADGLAAELLDWAGVLAAAWMVCSGFKRHRGEWRQGGPNVGKPNVGKPNVGSRAWERGLGDDPRHVREVLKSLTERSAGGDAGAARDMAVLLDRHPHLKDTVPALKELTAKAEAAWVAVAAGGDKAARRAVEAEVEKLKAELLPADAGVLDRVLVGAIVVAHLAHANAALAAATPTEHPSVQAAREKRLTGAQQRLVAAARGWSTVAGKKTAGVKPPPLKLFAGG